MTCDSDGLGIAPRTRLRLDHAVGTALHQGTKVQLWAYTVKPSVVVKYSTPDDDKVKCPKIALP